MFNSLYIYIYLSIPMMGNGKKRAGKGVIKTYCQDMSTFLKTKKPENKISFKQKPTFHYDTQGSEEVSLGVRQDRVNVTISNEPRLALQHPTQFVKDDSCGIYCNTRWTTKSPSLPFDTDHRPQICGFLLVQRFLNISNKQLISRAHFPFPSKMEHVMTQREREREYVCVCACVCKTLGSL